MSGSNNSLSLFVQTFSGVSKQAWRLHGDHGNEWNFASIKLSPNEDLMVILLCLFFINLFKFPISAFEELAYLD